MACSMSTSFNVPSFWTSSVLGCTPPYADALRRGDQVVVNQSLIVRAGIYRELGQLARAAAHDVRAHAERLLAASQRPPAPAPTGGGADDELSEREREVLRLLATELSGPEIAGHLYISVNTLRTHTKHIFSKLDVNTRRAAVRRAADLGLL